MYDAKEMLLDYFKFYPFVKPIRFTTAIPTELKGQFDKEFTKVRLAVLRGFGDRADKNGEGLYDPNAHLNVYLTYPDDSITVRKVKTFNQFFPDGQSILIGRLAAILVPAQKRRRPKEKTLPRPEFTKETRLLDHFKVYRARADGETESFPEKPFILKDQFGEHRITLYGPRYFAVPVAKRMPHEHPLLHPKDPPHLTIYEIHKEYSPDEEGIVIDVRDQFLTRYGLMLDWTHYIGVPSKKKLV